MVSQQALKNRNLNHGRNKTDGSEINIFRSFGIQNDTDETWEVFANVRRIHLLSATYVRELLLLQKGLWLQG